MRLKQQTNCIAQIKLPSWIGARVGLT